MDAREAEELCDTLSDLAGKGPSKDPAALVEAKAILRKITQWPDATPHVRERATEAETALRGWLDAEDQHRALLKGYSRDIYILIDRLHGAIRDALRFRR